MTTTSGAAAEGPPISLRSPSASARGVTCGAGSGTTKPAVASTVMPGTPRGGGSCSASPPPAGGPPTVRRVRRACSIGLRARRIAPHRRERRPRRNEDPRSPARITVVGLSLPKDTTDDQRHAAWVDVIRRASNEHTDQAWSNYMFRLLRAIATINPWLAEPGGFFAAGTECLLQLLYDMRDYPTVVTRTRFVADRPADMRDLGDKAFSKYAGGPGEHLSLDTINADLERLKEAEAIRVHAEQTRAHRTPVQAID